MNAWAGVAVAGTLGVYALVSARLSKTIVSGPMLFVAAGLALGPLGLGLLTLGKDAEPVRVLFEVTLALVLFTDALSVQSKALRRDDFLPIRLLAVPTLNWTQTKEHVVQAAERGFGAPALHIGVAAG